MINIVIPMAGLGSRFSQYNTDRPKPLININGKTLIEHSLSSIKTDARYIFITRKYKNEEHNAELTNIIKNFSPTSVEIKIDFNTSGAAETCLYAKDLIDNEDKLIITNCDQIFNFDFNNFIDFINNNDVDGSVGLHKSNNPKHSYAIIKNNKIVSIKEKTVISEDALVGLHYWKNGKDFIRSAELLLSNFKKESIQETYISETYGYLINEGKNISPYYLPHNSYICLGTPEDVEIYLAKVKEYYEPKPKTIFCDIDGTLIKHVHRFSYVGFEPAIALKGVIQKFNEWDSKGHKIILTTARKESARMLTEKQLTDLGLCWDQLIMGVSSGVRVLINDKHLDSDNDRAIAINVITDQGFEEVDWNEIGL